MRGILFIWIILFATQAQADYAARCGEDDFGNTVCMDRNGVLTTTPNRTADDKKSAAGGKPDGKDENRVQRRCAVDQFGNTVCGEMPVKRQQ